MGYSQLYLDFMNKNKLYLKTMQIETMEIELLPESESSLIDNEHDNSQGCYT